MRAAAAKGVLGLAHADGRLHRELAENAQHVMAVAAADEEPRTVGDQAGRNPRQQGQPETDFLVGRKSAGRQQHRRSRKRNAELLHQNPAEQQDVTVNEKNVRGQRHGDRTPILELYVEASPGGKRERKRGSLNLWDEVSSKSFHRL